LTCSNGSAHERQRRSALHAVAPKRDCSSVSADPHKGQRTDATGGDSVSGIGPGRRGAAPGGAIPAEASFRRPEAEIQSDDHAGDSCVRISTSE
jgi:hypothetical protein